MNMNNLQVFKEQIEQISVEQKPSILSIFGGNEIKAEKFISDVKMISMDDNLIGCNPKSVVLSAIKIAQLDLSVVRDKKQAFIIPRIHRVRGKEAEIQISYIGWKILARRAGYHIDCELVYKCDKNLTYRITETGREIYFDANILERQNEDSEWVNKNLIGAVVWTKSNELVQKDFISAAKLNKIKMNSPSIKFKRHSAWDDWAEEMYKAKAIKYVASKLAIDNDALAKAINFENEVEAEISTENKKIKSLNKLFANKLNYLENNEIKVDGSKDELGSNNNIENDLNQKKQAVIECLKSAPDLSALAEIFNEYKNEFKEYPEEMYEIIMEKDKMKNKLMNNA